MPPPDSANGNKRTASESWKTRLNSASIWARVRGTSRHAGLLTLDAHVVVGLRDADGKVPRVVTQKGPVAFRVALARDEDVACAGRWEDRRPEDALRPSDGVPLATGQPVGSPGRKELLLVPFLPGLGHCQILLPLLGECKLCSAAIRPGRQGGNDREAECGKPSVHKGISTRLRAAPRGVRRPWCFVPRRGEDYMPQARLAKARIVRGHAARQRGRSRPGRPPVPPGGPQGRDAAGRARRRRGRTAEKSPALGGATLRWPSRHSSGCCRPCRRSDGGPIVPWARPAAPRSGTAGGRPPARRRPSTGKSG